jgi:ABC-type multidrug transport system permease subunit
MQVNLVRDAARWFFFYFTLVLVDLCMGALFRFFAYILPDMESAQVRRRGATAAAASEYHGSF